MSDFEMAVLCLLIPIAYVVIYIAGKYDILYQICKILEKNMQRIKDEEQMKGE